MSMVFKVNFKTKSYKNKSSNRAVKYRGVIYIKYQIVNKIVSILCAELVLKESEYNEHQQKGWTTKKGKRKSFANEFSLKFNSIKNYISLNEEQIKWWNTNLLDSGESILSISKYLTGNNPTGSQQSKKSAEMILDEVIYNEMPFYNLLKVFSTKKAIKSAYVSNKEDAESFKDFLEKISNINKDYKYVIDNFYSDKKFFYIDEMKDFIGEKNDEIITMRRMFRNDLISTYERKDQLYKVFESRKMVEAAHILPVTIIKNNNEYSNDLIKDINNGLLLSPDIHKLFDSGAIAFSSTTGKIEYTTNPNNYPYNVSKQEVQRLELDIHQLSQEVLSEKRKMMLDLHKKLVYQKGI